MANVGIEELSENPIQGHDRLPRGAGRSDGVAQYYAALGAWSTRYMTTPVG
jgi:hypothetical protein